jgi:hypothetical protein
MRLYHSRFTNAFISLLVAIICLSACQPSQTVQDTFSITLAADGDETNITLPAGSTVQNALDQRGITLEYLDKVEPPAFTVLSGGEKIEVTRVREEFNVEEEVIPFERKVLQTESLPDHETLLAQSGVNGVREITNRIVYENGVEVSRYPVRESVVKEAVPEIVMVGIRTPFIPINIPGRIAYLLGGNAWIMDQSTGNRKPVVVTGDLDGHIFSLSEDGTHLLFTRRGDGEDVINTLWAADLTTDPVETFDLGIENVIHFAAWLPDPKNDKIAFSTVEPRPTAPGWQANNDLNLISYSSSGWVSRWKVYVDANSGGVYGWWGTDYSLEPGGDRVIYIRPDSIGFVNMEDGSLNQLIEIIPVQTGGDWAWVPGLGWSPDGKMIYTVDHVAPAGSAKPEESTQFDLTAILLDSGGRIPLVPQAGMFAYPTVSPTINVSAKEGEYWVAYLQSIFPNQSENSPYRLVVMDRDGSNQRTLYPPEGESGLEPQQVAWSPDILPGTDSLFIAVINEGNLWLIDASGVEPPRQITGDGLVTRVDWK